VSQSGAEGQSRAEGPSTAAPGSADAETIAAVEDAGSRLRAPWAASLAGMLFAILFAGSLILIRSSPITTATDADLGRLFAEGADRPILIGSLYLAPFAGIMFLWFIAVIRDQVGEREDRFFATVFFGSGLLFVALLFISAAVTSSIVVGVRYLGMDAPTAAEMDTLRALAYTLLFVSATRAAAVCVISIATLGLRSRTFPAWFAITGYVLGLVLLVVVTFWDWIMLLLPAWVAVVSLFILRRERLRAQATRAGRAPRD
jgi:hypothetical protein